MRQLLMLGFYCEVYRQEPLCRVYVDDILLDEFNIPHTPYKNTFTSDKNLDPTFWTRDQYELKFNPPFFKILELDDAEKRFLNLRVEIQNNDNNHTNGFMNRSTQIMFNQCWLAPVKIWEEFEQIQDRWKFSRRNWQKWYGRIKSVTHYYTESRHCIFENLARYVQMHFSGIDQSIDQRPSWPSEQLKLIGNHQYFTPLLHKSVANHWLGSSGHFNLTVSKKFGFWRPGRDCGRGWRKLSTIRDIKYLYDKYKNDEDTRSTD